MDLISDKKSIKAEFEAQVTAALMIQSNALIPFKLAVRLCGISRQEINRRIAVNSFTVPWSTQSILPCTSINFIDSSECEIER